ncbi:hypothetical protein [Hymenobacter antarcticus]|uniref:hypothetical protein n=1 Tax=Hymenobacter antarcticus TaxID=486270 RepID=UPI0031F12005
MLPSAEEFPIEELDGVPDWSATAWAQIQARDAKAVQPSQLGSYLAAASLGSLNSMKAVLTREPEDAALFEAIRAEIERRRTDGTSATL